MKASKLVLFLGVLALGATLISWLALSKGKFLRLVSYPKNSGKAVLHIAGGIVPHHLLAESIIVEFFQKLSSQEVQTIVLVGPNHSEKGNARVISSLRNWQMPLGIIEKEEDVIRGLLGERSITLEDNVIKDEFSITNLLPFIGRYLPKAKIVPMILSNKNSQEDLMNLSEKLVNSWGEGTVLVGSVDFSHYLTSSEARKKDEETIKLLENFDYPYLLSLGSDHLDSPASLVLILMTMKKLGKTQIEVLRHINSGEIVQNNLIPTTSYFSLAFH